MDYSQELKTKVVEEFLAGNIRKSELRKKYNILGNGTIDRWIIKYNKDKINFDTFNGSKNEGNYFNNGTVIMSKQQVNTLDSLTKQVKELEKEVAKLQNDRDTFKYKSIIYENLVEFAEKKYKINIKKNI